MNNIDIYGEFEEITNEKTTKENKGRKLHITLTKEHIAVLSLMLSGTKKTDVTV